MILILVIFFLGLIFGSFVSAVSYRIPRSISFISGRSFCPICKKEIAWYDNIPLLSFFLLCGRCRHCGEKISWRYPLIEFITGIGFVLIYLFYLSCFGQGQTLSNNLFCLQAEKWGFVTLPYWFLIFILLLIILIIDLEDRVIFDNLVFIIFVIFLSTSLFFFNANFYSNLLVAFSSSLFFLILHLVTLGRGMGLGDVKLALPLGFLLGFPLALVWLFFSFLTGALVGIILILLGKARFGKPIPFGPFMIFSFWLTLFWGERIVLFF